MSKSWHAERIRGVITLDSDADCDVLTVSDELAKRAPVDAARFKPARK